MICSLCGLNFPSEQGRNTCSHCVMTMTCNLVRCPNCGFEMATESKLGKFIKKWRKK